jgi:hypothetical protein
MTLPTSLQKQANKQKRVQCVHRAYAVTKRMCVTKTLHHLINRALRFVKCFLNVKGVRQFTMQMSKMVMKFLCFHWCHYFDWSSVYNWLFAHKVHQSSHSRLTYQGHQSITLTTYDHDMYYPICNWPIDVKRYSQHSTVANVYMACVTFATFFYTYGLPGYKSRPFHQT